MDYKCELSTLNHTWILDLDGTLVKHNGYLIDGVDTVLPGTHQFMQQIPADDMVVIITSRKSSYREVTEAFLKQNKIRYDSIIFDAPMGERIVVNDEKPKGLKTALAINLQRDNNEGIELSLNDTL